MRRAPLPVLGALLLAAPQAQAAKFRFQRVDLISEAPGSFLNYDLPMFDVNLQTSAIRWVEQIQVVFELPVQGLSAGISLDSQTLCYERPLLPAAGLYYGGGIQTDLLMPRGLLVDSSWRWRRLRLAVGASAVSGSTWRRPDWTSWDLLPTAGIGVGREHEPAAR